MLVRQKWASQVVVPNTYWMRSDTVCAKGNRPFALIGTLSPSESVVMFWLDRKFGDLQTVK